MSGDAPLSTDHELANVVLEFEQRQRANALLEAIDADPMQAAFELIYLRDRAAMLLEAHTGCGCSHNCKVCIEKGYT